MPENDVSSGVSNSTEMTPQCRLSQYEMALKGLEIARKEIQRLYELGRMPRFVDESDLLSVADETINAFLRHYSDADESELGLLRTMIRMDYANALDRMRRESRGIEIPPGANAPHPVHYETPDWAALTDLGVITRKQGEVLVLSAAGYSQEQIAQFLSIGQPRVTRRLERALENLQNYFQKQGINTQRARIVGCEDKDVGHTAAER